MRLDGVERADLVDHRVVAQGHRREARTQARAMVDAHHPHRLPDSAGGSGMNGSHAEFTAFYERHHASVARALALTLGDTELGVEAADEAMTRACQRWADVATYANPEGWVYRVGLNWARSWLRRRRRTVTTPFAEPATGDRGDASARAVDDGAALGEAAVAPPEVVDPALVRALARLDHKHRSVVVLRYLLDWSVDRTAEALGIAQGTVKSRLHRALAQLATELGDTALPPTTPPAAPRAAPRHGRTARPAPSRQESE